MDLFISEQHAQEMLGVKRTTLWKLRSEGKLHYSKIGRKTLYHLPSIEDYIYSHSTLQFSNQNSIKNE